MTRRPTPRSAGFGRAIPSDRHGTALRRPATAMRRILLATVPLLALLMPGRAGAQEVASGALQMVQSLERDLRGLAALPPDGGQRRERFRQIFEQAFDVRAIGRFSLGRYWGAASPREQSAFLALFEDRLVAAYAARFARYAGATLRIAASETLGADHALVTTDLVVGSTTDRLQWRILRHDGRLRIVDLLVDGISLGTLQRADYMSVMHRGGGDMQRLLDMLRRRDEADYSGARMP